jgi:hypothetical protein
MAKVPGDGRIVGKRRARDALSCPDRLALAGRVQMVAPRNPLGDQAQ